LDEEAILKSLAKTKCIVTAEEHIRSWRKYFKSSIKQPCSQEFVAVNDSFGESGTLNGKNTS
jgi:transketolase